jgi:hypothetical protein
MFLAWDIFVLHDGSNQGRLIVHGHGNAIFGAKQPLNAVDEGIVESSQHQQFDHLPTIVKDSL